MAITVSTIHISLGNKKAVINTVTGDGTLKTWETGLSHVDFYTAITSADSDIILDTWYLNYSDNGTTAKEGAVCFNTAAPDTGENWICFGIGSP